jgi:hypothetical protein
VYEELTDVGTKGSRVTAAARTARPRRYLMCPPTFLDIAYSINPWMEPNKPIDAILQWRSGSACTSSIWSWGMR